MSSRPLLSFEYISLGLIRGKLSFKLTNLSNSLGACAVLPLSNPFQDLSEFCTLILSGLYPRFSQVRLLPFMVTTLDPTAHAS